MAITKVAEVVVGVGGSASIQFTSIPQTGKDLLLLISARANNYTSDFLYVQINGLTSNYKNIFMRGTGSGVTTQIRNNVSGFEVFYQGSSTTANTFGNGAIYLPNYTSSSDKSASFDHIWEQNAQAADTFIVAGSHSTTSPITSITLDGNSTDFVQYSTASLYIIS